jgi:hypothetical protein
VFRVATNAADGGRGEAALERQAHIVQARHRGADTRVLDEFEITRRVLVDDTRRANELLTV